VKTVVDSGCGFGRSEDANFTSSIGSTAQTETVVPSVGGIDVWHEQMRVMSKWGRTSVGIDNFGVSERGNRRFTAFGRLAAFRAGTRLEPALLDVGTSFFW
jgi:hypothetical protein